MVKKNAKEIYFDNFGNILTMKRNGEYRAYIRKRVPIEEESQWSIEIKNNLIDDIVNREEFFKIVPLSRLSLSENEFLEAFEIISSKCSKDVIRQNLERLQNLITPTLYDQLINLFK